MFEKLINTCLDYYGLDPCHYFSSPGLRRDAMLKFTGIKLELISDINMHLFIEKRNGWAMSQYLPYSEFKWLNQKEVSGFCLNSIEENNSIGYILEADLEYPSELHDLHNDYPLALEKFEISQYMLSNHCFNIVNEYVIKIGGDNKLVSNLGKKVNMFITEIFSCICH